MGKRLRKYKLLEKNKKYVNVKNLEKNFRKIKFGLKKKIKKLFLGLEFC